MRISGEDKEKQNEPTFSWVEPGTVFKSMHGRYYMKLEVGDHFKFNAVNLANGKIVGFNPKTKVIELLKATLNPNEDE